MCLDTEYFLYTLPFWTGLGRNMSTLWSGRLIYVMSTLWTLIVMTNPFLNTSIALSSNTVSLNQLCISQVWQVNSYMVDIHVWYKGKGMFLEARYIHVRCSTRYGCINLNIVVIQIPVPILRIGWPKKRLICPLHTIIDPWTIYH